MRETTPRPAAAKRNGHPPDQLRRIDDHLWSLVIHPSTVGEATPSRLTTAELIFIAGLASVIIIGWGTLVLAQLGWLTRSSLLLILIPLITAIVVLALARPSLRLPPVTPKSAIHNPQFTIHNSQFTICNLQSAICNLLPAGLLVIAAILYTPPADYAPAFLDAGWYTNAGALIARTGALAARPPALDELPAADRGLFVRTYRDVRASLRRFPDRPDVGFYNLAFAINLGKGGPVVPYHPPFASVWIAVLRLVGGPGLGTYAAPLFGLLFLVAVYAAGCAIFDRNIALVGVLLIALSPSVVYYGRTPFAELLAGALIWAGVYALTRYATTTSARPPRFSRARRRTQLQSRIPEPWQADAQRKPRRSERSSPPLPRPSAPPLPCSPAPALPRPSAPLLLLAGLAFGAALLTKFESLLLFPPVALFWLIWLRQRWATRREFVIFLIPFGLLTTHATLLYTTTLRPYTLLNGYGLWSILTAALHRPAVWSALTGLYVLVLIVLLAGRRAQILDIGYWILGIDTKYPASNIQYPIPNIQYPIPNTQYPISNIQSAISLLILAGAGVALLLAWPATQANASSPWSALGALSLFLTPLGLCLGIVGLSTLVARDLNRRTALLAMLLGTAGLATVLMPAISSNVSYLYTIRRQLPVVVPALLLLTAYVALRWAGLSEGGTRSSHPSVGLRRGVVMLVLAFVIFNFLDAGRPLVREQELAGSSTFIAGLAERFEPRDIVLFESVDRGAHVGRFAAPLWAEHDVAAMLLSSSYPAQGRLAAVVRQWQEQGRRVFFVSQSQPPLFTLPDFKWQLVDQRVWAGSTIAAKMTFPPKTWVVEVPFYIYEIRARTNWQQRPVPPQMSSPDFPQVPPSSPDSPRF